MTSRFMIIIIALSVMACENQKKDTTKKQGAVSKVDKNKGKMDHSDKKKHGDHKHGDHKHGDHKHDHAKHGHKHGHKHNSKKHHRFDKPEEFAQRWNDTARDAWQKPDEIMKLMTIPEGGVVADLGAGTGYLLPSLSKAVGAKGKVIAMDVEPSMVEFLKKYATDKKLTNITPKLVKMDDPGQSAGSVDRFVSLNVWHHIEGRKKYAAKLFAATKPGGSVYIVDFLKAKTEGFGPPLEMRLTESQVEEDLKSGGFTTETLKETLPRHYIIKATKPAS